MTTIVPTSEDNPVLSVVRFTSELAWADAGADVAEPQVSRLCLEAEESIVAGRWLELAKLMLTSAELVSSKVSEKDFECIYTVICNLVNNVESPDEILEMAKTLSSKISQQSNDKPALRLKIIFNLYNLLENKYACFHVYMKMLELAVSGKVTEYIVPSFKKIDSFLKNWNIDIQEQRELFLGIANVLKEKKSLAQESLKFLAKYLASFSGEDTNTMAEAKEVAASTIIEFVNAPGIFQCDLLDMPAVAQLEKDGQYTLIYQLLKIVLTQRLTAYLEFQTTNSAFLQTYGLVHEDCMVKMRMMSLVDLASEESGKIPYTLIRDTLQITDDEVELWVVKAISAKLIDCRMDQMNQLVVVSRCTERVFGEKQWGSLRAKLATWRGNVASVIGTIQANKITEEAGETTQGLTVR